MQWIAYVRKMIPFMATIAVMSACFASVVVLEPISGKVGRMKALVLIPGARVPAANYTDFLVKIQEQAAFPLVILGLDFSGGTPQPIGLKKRVVKLLEPFGYGESGGLGAEDVWIMGHSLGGIVARRIAEDFGGLVLLAAYFDRLSNREKTQIIDYKKPILILSGYQDGLTRFPYIVRDYPYDTRGHESGDWSRTMILLNGANHSFYAGNDTLEGDLHGDIEPQVARAMASNIIAAFLSQFTDSLTLLEITLKASELAEVKQMSDRLAKPYLEATTMDESTCEVAQFEILAPEFEQNEVLVSSTSKSNAREFAVAKPSITQVGDERVEVNVVQFNIHQSNLIDRGNLPLAPRAIACKMKSAASVTDLLWLQGKEPKPVSCAQIQLSIQQKILSLLSENQYRKYKESTGFLGLPQEKEHATGIGWLSNRSSIIDKNGDEYKLNVQSLYTNLQASFGLEGMTYCKLLSPSRMLEWYTLDSLLEARK